MIKFKERSVTEYVEIQLTNTTDDEDLSLRELRRMELKNGSLEIRANYVLHRSGDLVEVRGLHSVSGQGDNNIIILVVGSNTNSNQNEAIKTIYARIAEEFPNIKIVSYKE
ncbi:hypothetical protein LMJ14_04385 [Klebsiella pneumoniae]|uniref:hypothetical protein n=1 Tax=Klebsiella/Raoultella group TaxID=2890311 RepID=UPI001157F7CC|nr:MULTISPECIES: hypothetical protein [Klebsiella/Raoultella group]HBZ7523807.1 hypothetical protein [Klebsiella quasipneumoniae subsp. similipneumoniae]MCC4942728.1 hypothetical protein [Klebsiella pneumoniae]MCC4947282.1 hypothetical protein [Klebsiella pneumoniae]MCC4966128.1 hypothetical protein [Klebsiella pneumoniae]MCC4973842.1 hypothetical protein [Klebsiella pneumoniae]